MSDVREAVQRVKDIEDAILSIRASMDQLRDGRLTETAIVVLLKAMAPKSVKINDIKWVLENLPKLADMYLKDENEILLNRAPTTHRKGKSK